MLVDAIVLLLVGLLALLLPSSSVYRAHLSRRLVHQTRAHLPADQATALEARVARRARGMGAGIVLAGAGALVAALAWDGAEEARGGLLFLSLVFVGGAAGLATVDVLRPGAVPDGPRSARATVPTLADYVPRPLRILSWVFVGAGGVALATTLVLARSAWFDTTTLLSSPVPLLAVALPLLVVLCGLAVRRVLDAPQPARDEVELFWQDAVRAQTLNSLVATAPLVSLLALTVCGAVLDDAASAAALARGEVGPGWSLVLLVASYALPFVLVLVALALTVATGRRHSGGMHHFRDRLWGGRAAGRPGGSTVTGPSPSEA
ncbi:hypothetical protein [Ornithinimicrobium pekingense]|uniref:Uncharacterized protein n=1 Tax=Ornithinimicrobium pekingense TaxID=384677 RepID=A0ABQ2FAB2_9MICO|nr:hypothetical protein [Ornithinimicrobium pekingense]GGK68032.1 hypothetical protein GCM10011509_15530 [Ornithinimicrobium pekingense]